MTTTDQSRENLGEIWYALDAHATRYRIAYRDGRVDATVLGSIAADMRATINRIDTWREQQP